MKNQLISQWIERSLKQIPNSKREPILSNCLNFDSRMSGDFPALNQGITLPTVTYFQPEIGALLLQSSHQLHGWVRKLVIFHKITILQNSIYKQIRWLTMMNHQVWGYDIFRQIRGGVENVGWSKNDPFRSKNRWQLKPLWSFRKSSCGNPHSLSLGLEDVKKSVNPFLMLS